MSGRPRAKLRALVRRLRRFERREFGEFRAWLEDTRNLVHVSVVLFVPLLIGLVTLVSNAVAQISFLLFPPLASGTYTLFANPEGRYASPVKFVAGLTVGAFAGWLAFELSSHLLYGVPPGRFRVHAGAAALSILLTGVATWALDLEEPSAFSTALLVLVADPPAVVTVFGVAISAKFVYAVSVALSTSLVAAGFVVWREAYEHRAEFLYRTTQADDHVLVPMRGEGASATALFGARLASPHDASKVVLLDVVSTAAAGEAGTTTLEADGGADIPEPARAAADRLERTAARIETRVGVPTDVVVATGDPDDARTVLEIARETDCDLIVAPHEERHGRLSPFVRGLFASDLDVVAFRPSDPERTRWKRIMVPVERPGDVAHAMLDFAERLAGASGTVAVCHCIGAEDERRRAEDMLANLTETFEASFETRVATASIGAFLADNAPNYDLTIVGSSTDRSAASRFVSPPTFQRLESLDCDVAIVHRGRP